MGCRNPKMMLRVKISEEDLQVAKIERYQKHPPQTLKQLSVLAMCNDFSRREIAMAVGVSPKTVAEIVKRYSVSGMAAFLSPTRHRPASRLEPFRELLKSSFEQQCSPSVSEASDRITRLTGVELGPTQVRAFMKSMGMRFCKLGHVPAKADPAAQEVFLDEVMAPRLASCASGERHVFFMDSAHFVLSPFLSFVWAFCRTFIKAPSGRQRYNVLGALHAHTKELLTFRNTGYIDAKCVVSLFEQIVQRYGDLPVTVILDNARYQRCAFVQDAARRLDIELCFLPSYSPNLNLIERVWKIIKKRALNGKYHPDFSAFKEAIDKALDDFSAANHSSTLSLKFQTFRNVTFMAA